MPKKGEGDKTLEQVEGKGKEAPLEAHYPGDICRTDVPTTLPCDVDKRHPLAD